ncbi:MAG: acyloxyacyl hydrolase [Bacteroidia bacterium]|nr:acyloxyacyl hydrolase [Bacteroidia bacterium]
MRWRFFIVFNCIWISATVAQKKNVLSLSTSLYYGNILPHSIDIAPLATANPYGAQVSMAWQSLRSEASLSSPIRSKKGFRLAYSNFNNPEKLGQAWHFTGFTEPFLGSDKRLFLSFPLDAGISYLSKIYHPINNPENLFFGSRISFYLGAGVQLNYKLKERSILQANVTYQHISNGGIKAPNKGMNFPSIGIGYSHYISRPNFSRLEPMKRDAYSQKWDLKGFAYASLKTVPNPNELKPMAGVQLLYSRSNNAFHHLILGTELGYNGFKREFFNRQNEKVNPIEWSLQSGYQLKIGNTSLIVLMGAEVYNQQLKNSILYQRYGLVQQVNKKWFIAATLKANAHVADIFDVRLGYQLVKK